MASTLKSSPTPPLTKPVSSRLEKEKRQSAGPLGGIPQAQSPTSQDLLIDLLHVAVVWAGRSTGDEAAQGAVRWGHSLGAWARA